LSRCLTRQGRFDEAAEQWQTIVKAAPDAESSQALNDLQQGPHSAEGISMANLSAPDTLDATAMIVAAENHQRAGSFLAAEELLQRAQSAGGGDFRIHTAREELQLARSAHRVVIAKRRAAADPNPKAQSLVARLEQEHNRLEIDIFHVRSERHPSDRSLRLELARRLKKAGNYSGAIQRLEEARKDERLAADVSLELGECWQHLRQFGKALECYREATQCGPTVPVGQALSTDVNRHDLSDGNHQTTLAGALYRIGVLAAAMNRPDEAKAALSRLVAIDAGYKDARQRLDKLPRI